MKKILLIISILLLTGCNKQAKTIDVKDKEFYDIILSGLGFEVDFVYE